MNEGRELKLGIWVNHGT